MYCCNDVLWWIDLPIGGASGENNYCFHIDMDKWISNGAFNHDNIDLLHLDAGMLEKTFDYMQACILSDQTQWVCKLKLETNQLLLKKITSAAVYL